MICIDILKEGKIQLPKVTTDSHLSSSILPFCQYKSHWPIKMFARTFSFRLTISKLLQDKGNAIEWGGESAGGES